MGAVRMIARAELRRRSRPILLLAIFVGFAGAVVLTLAAGARRTDSALARFERDARSADLVVVAGDASEEQLARFRAVSGVAGVGMLRQVTLVVPGEELFLPSAAARTRPAVVLRSE
jgi:hypothetical protein